MSSSISTHNKILLPTVQKSTPSTRSPVAAAPARVPLSKRSDSATSNNNLAKQAEVDDLTNQLMDMRLNLDGLEKERDFYYSKLRDIEIL